MMTKMRLSIQCKDEDEYKIKVDEDENLMGQGR